MKKHIILAVIVVVMLCGVGIIGKNMLIIDSSAENKLSTWKEISIKDGASYSRCSGVEAFDLKESISKADYIFSGEVISRKEYEVEWTDDNGEKWGPFPSSVLEVKISDEYYGLSPTKDGVIKVYYPYSLSMVFDGSFIIKDKGEYVFITQDLDKEFVNEKKKIAPDDNFQQEEHADVYITNPCYDIMAIDGDTVLLQNDYFSWNKDIMKKTKKYEKVKRNIMSSPKLIESGWFIALDKSDFEKAFSKVIKNPRKIQDVSDLKK